MLSDYLVALLCIGAMNKIESGCMFTNSCSNRLSGRFEPVVWILLCFTLRGCGQCQRSISLHGYYSFSL